VIAAGMNKSHGSVRNARFSFCMATACASALIAFAAHSAQSDSDARNFEGSWSPQMDMAALGPPNSMPSSPYNAEGRRVMQKRLELNRPEKPLVLSHLGCRPSIGGGGSLNTLILQTPTELTLISHNEDRMVWPIYIDQPHSKPLRPSYVGDSVAHWEGDTLVVDSVGFNGRGGEMSVFSDKLHVTTRISKSADDNTLTLSSTYEDPVYYTAPFTRTTKLRRTTEHRLADLDCAEAPRSDEAERRTYEDDWFKPTCVFPVIDGQLGDKVVCTPRPKHR
jgi:hypothetical protein